MKAVCWKELRELAVAGGPLLVLAVLVSLLSDLGPRLLDTLAALATLAGALLGAIQGLLDRRRRGDLFLLHRPLARWKLHLARTLAGLTVVVLPAVLLLLIWSLRFGPVVREIALGEIVTNPFRDPMVLRLLGASAAAWSVVRLTISVRRPVWALLCLLTLPVAFAALVWRGDGAWSVFGVLFAGVVVFSTASVVQLSEAA